MDELFTRYMYFVRAKMGIKSSTTEALRKFYEKDNYALLKKDSTFNDMITLAHFWEDVSNQDRDRILPADFAQIICAKLCAKWYVDVFCIRLFYEKQRCQWHA